MLNSSKVAFKSNTNISENCSIFQHIQAYFPDNIFKCIFFHEDVSIPNTIWLKFVVEGQIDNNSALVQIMARRRTGAKPLSEPMMAYVGDACMSCSASMS